VIALSLTPAADALLVLTAIVAALSAALTFAVLRFLAAARSTRALMSGRRGESALMSTALEEAVAKLKAQERATAARAEASERLSSEIIASLTAGLLVVDLDAEVRILNPAGRRMLGVPESMTVKDVQSVLRRATLTQLIDECMRTRVAVVRRTVELPEGQSSASHIGVTVSPLFDDRAELHGAICLFTDLTAVKALEEQLRLKESLATVGELTAGIAHEFRNGLATIGGYGKLLDLEALPEAYRPYVEGIRTESNSLSQIVTNFLNFAKPAQLTLTKVDLRAVCERAAEEMRGEARALGGDVTIRGDFVALEGDEVLLRQAFNNLLRNAVEACAGASRAPVVVIQSEMDSTQRVSRISVNDNGPGIRPEARERVFRPFFTSKHNGTGLGLSLVQKIIVLHNGRITAASSPLGGASLQITLPLAG